MMKPLNPVNENNLNAETNTVFATTKQALGFVPNIYKYIAHSEHIFKQFNQMNSAFASSGFNATERELIQLSTSNVNQCSYCIAGHKYFAHVQNISSDIVNEILTAKPLKDAKLDALNQLCLALVSQRGSIDNSLINTFLDEGYSQAQFIELIMGISLKTFTNLLSKSAAIEIDEEFLTINKQAVA